MKRLVPIILSALILQGCAAIALTAGGLAAGQGIDHTLTGITYKTFNSPMNQLRLATLKTLHRLDMKVTGDSKTEEGRKILATAVARKIEIEFEILTRRATRMRVIVSKGAILKDSATATEIIIQTAETLDRQTAASENREMRAQSTPHRHSASVKR